MKVGESVVIKCATMEVNSLALFSLLKKGKTYQLKLSEDKWVGLKLVGSMRPFLLLIPSKTNLSVELSR